MRRLCSALTLVVSLVIGYLGLHFLFSSKHTAHPPSISTEPGGREMAAALQPLKFLTVAPRAKHTATVIFVHVSVPFPCSIYALLTLTGNLKRLGSGGHGCRVEARGGHVRAGAGIPARQVDSASCVSTTLSPHIYHIQLLNGTMHPVPLSLLPPTAG